MARSVESLGYSTLTMPDHFGDQFAPVPALMAAADATDDLRVGALVWDNDYKHPIVLAKELATIDVLSGGRLEIGIGAGWMVTDYEQSGIPYDSNKVRIDRFEEGLAVIKGAMSSEAVLVHRRALHGHRLHRAPQPVQRRARRSSSVAAASACCRSRRARPTSSASTARSRQAPSDPTRSPR